MSERDIADLELPVGHRVLLRRKFAVIASDKPAAVSGNTTLEHPITVPLNMAQEFATIEAVLAWVPTKLRARLTSLRSLRLPSSA